MENRYKLPGTTERLVELIGIAKDVIAGNVKESEFKPHNNLDAQIFKDCLAILRSGKEVEIPNNFTI